MRQGSLRKILFSRGGPRVAEKKKSVSSMTNIYTSFADTSAFYALEDSDDQHHEEAVEIREAIKREDLPVKRLYTSNYVLDETLTLLRMNLGQKHAVDFGERLRKSEIVVTNRINEGLEEKAWEIFKKHDDKKYSFTDATSFALMEKLNINKAFAFDKNFKQYGFTTISP